MSFLADRARALAAVNRRTLETFSRRTVDALRDMLPLRLVLPHLDSHVVYRCGRS